MEDFTTALPFIIFFLIMVMLVHMTLGEKMTVNLLILILIGMVLQNVDKIENLLSKVGFTNE